MKSGEERGRAGKSGEERGRAEKRGEEGRRVEKSGEERGRAEKSGEERRRAGKSGEERGSAGKCGEVRGRAGAHEDEPCPSRVLGAVATVSNRGAAHRIAQRPSPQPQDRRIGASLGPQGSHRGWNSALDRWFSLGSGVFTRPSDPWAELGPSPKSAAPSQNPAVAPACTNRLSANIRRAHMHAHSRARAHWGVCACARTQAIELVRACA